MKRGIDLQLKEDRALRDAAKALLIADIANLRADLAGKGVGERIIDRIEDGAVDVFGEAVDLANSNRSVLAVLLGAILLWFARNPIIALFTDDAGDKDCGEDCGEIDKGEPACSQNAAIKDE